MKIVVGFTDRPEGRAALDRAVAEAELRSAHLHIVRALAIRSSEDPDRVLAWAAEVEQAERELQEVVARLGERGIHASFDVEPDAPAAEVLLDAAREQEADLLVIGIRQRSAVGKLIMGSVSQDVLLGADCPVLAVKSAG